MHKSVSDATLPRARGRFGYTYKKSRSIPAFYGLFIVTIMVLNKSITFIHSPHSGAGADMDQSTHWAPLNEGAGFPPCLERALPHFERRSFRPKAVIYSSELHNTLCCVISGSATVYVEEPINQPVVTDYLFPGELFTAESLADPGPAPTIVVRARTASEVGFLSWNRFRDLAHDDPELFELILAQWGRRQRRLEIKVHDLARADVAQRVERALRHLARLPNAAPHPGGMQVRITRQELGQFVGCSREMAGRVLKSLQQSGALMLRGRTIVVRDATR